MKINETIDFSNVEGLKRLLNPEKITLKRFSLDLSPQECLNGLRASYETEVELVGKIFRPDVHFFDRIKKISSWLTTSNSKNGLMLMGLYGNGKTTMLKAICALISLSVRLSQPLEKWMEVKFVKSRKVASLFLKDDFSKEFNGLCKTQLLAIDDLGEEPYEIMKFGMNYHPLADLLQERYDRRLFTLVSTNLTGEELSAQYGKRIYDRLKEMMEIIVFKNESFRK